MSGALIDQFDVGDQGFLERYPLDMDAVTKMAITRKPDSTLRRYHLEFDCDGHPFIWDGAADSEREAITLGRLAIELDGRFDPTSPLAICLDRGRA